MWSKEFEKLKNSYWRYFWELGKDFATTRKFVEFDQGNYQTFSIEYLKLYQAICSEIDVLGKELAQQFDPSFVPEERRNNIYKWWLVVADKARFYEKIDGDIRTTKLDDVEVTFDMKIKVRPWENFRVEKAVAKDGKHIIKLTEGAKSPSWWNDYNSVKHHRTGKLKKTEAINYTKANLFNVIQSYSALYILEKAYMYQIGTKQDLEGFVDEMGLFGFEISEISNQAIDALFE